MHSRATSLTCARTCLQARSGELETVIKPALLAHTSAVDSSGELHSTGLAYLQLRHRLLLVYLLNLGFYLYAVPDPFC